MSFKDEKQNIEHTNTIRQSPLRGEVLLVENPDIAQQSIASQIAFTGVNITLAESGKHAIELVISKNFDLIMLDIDLPAMDGKNTLQGLLQLGFNIPIYALGINITSQNPEEYKQLGFYDILDKHRDSSKIKAALKQHLSIPAQKVSAENKVGAKLNAKIVQLKPKFLATLLTHHHQLCEYSEHQNYVQIVKILHIIKGSAGSFGYNSLTTIANDALVSLKLEKFDDAPSLITNVIVCIDKILRSEECRD